MSQDAVEAMNQQMASVGISSSTTTTTTAASSSSSAVISQTFSSSYFVFGKREIPNADSIYAIITSFLWAGEIALSFSTVCRELNRFSQTLWEKLLERDLHFRIRRDNEEIDNDALSAQQLKKMYFGLHRTSWRWRRVVKECTDFDNILTFIVVGDRMVGKTTLLTRLTGDDDDKIRDIPKKGVGCLTTSVATKPSQHIVKINIYDSNCPEVTKYSNYIKTFCLFTQATFIVYNVTSRVSFEHVRDKWLKLVRSSVSEKNCIWIIGTHADCAEHEREVQYEELMELIQDEGVNGTEVGFAPSPAHADILLSACNQAFIRFVERREPSKEHQQWIRDMVDSKKILDILEPDSEDEEPLKPADRPVLNPFEDEEEAKAAKNKSDEGGDAAVGTAGGNLATVKRRKANREKRDVPLNDEEGKKHVPGSTVIYKYLKARAEDPEYDKVPGSEADEMMMLGAGALGAFMGGDLFGKSNGTAPPEQTALTKGTSVTAADGNSSSPSAPKKKKEISFPRLSLRNRLLNKDNEENNQNNNNNNSGSSSSNDMPKSARARLRAPSLFPLPKLPDRPHLRRFTIRKGDRDSQKSHRVASSAPEEDEETTSAALPQPQYGTDLDAYGDFGAVSISSLTDRRKQNTIGADAPYMVSLSTSLPNSARTHREGPSLMKVAEASDVDMMLL